MHRFKDVKTWHRFGNIGVHPQLVGRVLGVGSSSPSSLSTSPDLEFIAFFALNVARVHADLLVVLFQSGHVLPGFGELAFLHTLANIPKQK